MGDLEDSVEGLTNKGGKGQGGKKGEEVKGEKAKL